MNQPQSWLSWTFGEGSELSLCWHWCIELSNRWNTAFSFRYKETSQEQLDQGQLQFSNAVPFIGVPDARIPCTPASGADGNGPYSKFYCRRTYIPLGPLVWRAPARKLPQYRICFGSNRLIPESGWYAFLSCHNGNRLSCRVPNMTAHVSFCTDSWALYLTTFFNSISPAQS